MTTAKSKIPTFTSLEEEATFWDSHDTTDFEDEFKPIQVKFVKPLEKGITVRLDKETLHILRLTASAKRMGATTLVRMWVMEKLNERHPQKF